MNTKLSDLILSAKNISKKFGKNKVLLQVNLDLPAGVIYGINGPNGAGKSLFLRILSGLVLADAGEVQVFGKIIGKDAEFAPSTGILIDSPGFLLGCSGLKNLQLLASVSGNVSQERINEVITLVGLNPNDRRPVSSYSTGMRQRLGLAQAIMEDQDLLILDEPTSGLDFDGQREIYSYLVNLRNKGKTILITSHSKDELNILCDQIFTLNNGVLTKN